MLGKYFRKKNYKNDDIYINSFEELKNIEKFIINTFKIKKYF